MAIEIRENKKTAKFNVGDICMLTSEVSFRDKEGNLCEIPQGSVVKIRTVCKEDGLFLYCVSDCNGKPVVGTVGEWKLKLATEDNINELLKNANDDKKLYLKQGIKSFLVYLAGAIIIIAAMFILRFFFGNMESKAENIILSGLVVICSFFLTLAGLLVAKEYVADAVRCAKDKEKAVELTRKELNIIEK